jgi:hypothetical protein
MDLRRAVGIPTSLTVLIALPFLVSSPKPAPKPAAPLEASVTLATEGTGTEFLQLRSPGSVKADGYLASPDGRTGATVKKVGQAACKGASRARPAETDADDPETCLEISGLPKHGEVAGTVSVAGITDQDQGTTLTLTVQRRPEFVGSPLIVLIAGLLVGLMVALIPPWLASRIAGLRLAWLLWYAELQRAEDRIAGARAWAEDRLDGHTAAAVRGPLLLVVKQGPARARAARSALSAALDAAQLGSDHPLARKARAEAARNDHHISHFLDGEGNEIDHPAAALTADVNLLEALRVRIAALAAASAPWPELEVARRAWENASETGAIDHVAELVQAAADVQPMTRGVTERGLGRQAVEQLPLGTARLIGLIGSAAALTIIFILVAVGFAVVTVYLANYEAEPTFGSFADYFALFSAAVGSSAAGAFLGLLAPWGASASRQGE